MKVKEIFYSIQGEGRNAGRVAVFCRFAGCNLACPWCDTDFIGGADYSEDDLEAAIVSEWHSSGLPFVVFTGGEPALQLTDTLIHRMRCAGFDVAVESNGTKILPEGVYWRTVSPKEGKAFVQRSGNELKIVWPQQFDLREMERLNFAHFYLQPMDGFEDSMKITTEAVLANPRWKLSLQTHKVLGIR